MQRLVTIIAALMWSLTMMGQGSEAVLRGVAERLAEMAPWRMEFSLRMDAAEAPSKGYCVVAGEKYVIAIDDMVQGCDGATLWMENGRTREVTLDEPKSESLSLFDNPTRAFDFATDLFAVDFTERTDGGELRLVLRPAEGVLEGVERVVIEVDEKSGLPTRLGYDFAGVGLYVDIDSIGPYKPSDGEFEVRPKEGFEVIDFR